MPSESVPTNLKAKTIGVSTSHIEDRTTLLHRTIHLSPRLTNCSRFTSTLKLTYRVETQRAMPKIRIMEFRHSLEQWETHPLSSRPSWLWGGSHHSHSMDKRLSRFLKTRKIRITTTYSDFVWSNWIGMLTTSYLSTWASIKYARDPKTNSEML